MKNFSFPRKLIYTLGGILFGLLFPLGASLLACYNRFNRINMVLMFEVQSSEPLLWVIDSAPLWLGLLAFVTGLNSDRLRKEIRRVKRIQRLLRERNRSMLEDFTAAKAVQESFLPRIPDYKPADIGYRYLPMSQVGGDFLSITKFHDNSAGIFIGDVSGHGISAALINSMTLALLNKICRIHGYDPAGYLNALNEELLNLIPAGKFISAIFALLKYEEGGLKLIFSRAGHPYPLIWRKRSRTVELFSSGGTILGCFNEINCENSTVLLEEGDIIFLYTDGVIELDDGMGEQLGIEGLMNLIEQLSPDSESIGAILDRIFDRLRVFSRVSRVEDDMILIAVRINPPLQP